MSAQTSIRQLDADFEKIQKKLQEGWAKQKHYRRRRGVVWCEG